MCQIYPAESGHLPDIRPFPPKPTSQSQWISGMSSSSELEVKYPAEYPAIRRVPDI